MYSTLAMASLRLFKPWYVSPPTCAHHEPCQFHTCPMVCLFTRTSYWFSPVFCNSAILSSYPQYTSLFILNLTCIISSVA
jgi:hypothetical protein